MATSSTSRSPTPFSSSQCLFSSSLSSLFLSCIQARKDKKSRNKTPHAIPHTSSDSTCAHPTPTTPTCTCTHRYSTPTALPPVPRAGTTYNPNPAPTLNSISITQTTSIRIVESDSSSDYDSTSSDADTSSLSDYGCDCGSPHHDHDFAKDGHDCGCEACISGYDDIDLDLPECPQPAIKRTLSNRPLPPLPSTSSSSSPRKHSEIKTRFIEETIPEEDEDEYLAQCIKEQEAEEAKRHKRTTSRRKSMIELFNLSSPFASGSGSGSSSRPCSGAGLGMPGLSLSFSNLNFRFPLPPVWGSQSQTQTQAQTQTQTPQDQDVERKEKKRPMSMSVLPPSTTIPHMEEKATLHETLTQTPSTTITISATSTTTKKERRMGTVLFPPLALLSRSSVASNRDSTGSGRSLFC
ncbi:hypothetical protein BJY04DRAFT_185611 [Aspergillus karnatakaensis]|uniref:uncharacterized protein n=1 Tax=Aspergillus karnatakaensis TaxID=1810916 RepID=UPI003CCCA515